MLHASLSDLGTYEALLTHPTWRSALEWLRGIAPDIALGTHQIQGDQMFASVQEYETVGRDQARFESHREHVDLQYTIQGEEGIDWIPRSLLEPNGPFAKDVQFWLPPAGIYSTVVNTAGRFSIFYPEDAHRPKVRVASERVRKLVIKVNVALL